MRERHNISRKSHHAYMALASFMTTRNKLYPSFRLSRPCHDSQSSMVLCRKELYHWKSKELLNHGQSKLLSDTPATLDQEWGWRWRDRTVDDGSESALRSIPWYMPMDRHWKSLVSVSFSHVYCAQIWFPMPKVSAVKIHVLMNSLDPTL